MKRILIQNGTLYDGLGGQPYQADLLVQDDRIAQIAPGITEPADQVIDATGKVVTPGFVDIHRHHDAKPLNDPHFGEVELAQGITTAVAGNCGISMTPRPESDEAAKEYYSFEEAVMGPIGLDGPHTYRDYLAALHKADLPLNVAAMIGTGTVKICVKGFADTPYTQQELDDARALIEDAMAAGAPGVSLGIMYLPECYSTTDEFVEILKPLGKAGRVLTAHIRGEGDSLETASVSGSLSQLREVRLGLRTGKKVTRALVRFEREELAWQTTIKAEDFSLGSFKTPKVEREEDDDPDAAFLEKMYLMELCLGLFDACYKQFLDIRLSSLWDKEVQDMSAWMSQQA